MNGAARDVARRVGAVTPFATKATMRVGVALACAVAAARQQEVVVPTPLRDFTVRCPATYRFTDDTFSGGGHLFEYYHFLIDFAPRVLETLEANGRAHP